MNYEINRLLGLLIIKDSYADDILKLYYEHYAEFESKYKIGHETDHYQKKCLRRILKYCIFVKKESLHNRDKAKLLYKKLKCCHPPIPMIQDESLSDARLFYKHYRLKIKECTLNDEQQLQIYTDVIDTLWSYPNKNFTQLNNEYEIKYWSKRLDIIAAYNARSMRY